MTKYRRAVFLLLATCPQGTAAAQDQDTGWRTDWEVEGGFRIDADALGFELPTAIAFVPNPGALSSLQYNREGLVVKGAELVGLGEKELGLRCAGLDHDTARLIA